MKMPGDSTILSDVEVILSWPIAAVKEKTWKAAAIAVAAMWYVGGGFPGQGLPCEQMLKGYLAGGVAYYGALTIGLDRTSAPPGKSAY